MTKKKSKKKTKRPEILDEYRKKNCAVGEGCIGQVVGHHIRSKGASGPDTENNLIALCIRHHRHIHNWGNTKFILEYPQVRREFLAKGWLYDQYRQRWCNYNLK